MIAPLFVCPGQGVHRPIAAMPGCAQMSVDLIVKESGGSPYFVYELSHYLTEGGELTDSDGRVFRAGDFVSYEAGTRHHSRSEQGCLIAVFEWRKPEPSGA